MAHAQKRTHAREEVSHKLSKSSTVKKPKRSTPESSKPSVKHFEKDKELGGQKKFTKKKVETKRSTPESSKPSVKHFEKGKELGGQKKFTKKKVETKDKEKPVVKLTSKESHAKSKLLRTERRQKDRSHYDVTVEIKKIWEDLRRQDVSKEKRAQLCDKVMTLVRGKERDFVFAHDTTRIFQTLCKYAPTSVRSELFTSLKECVIEMTKSKYSVFFVRSLLRRGNKEEKKYIIEKLMVNARKLLIHKLAGPVVEFAYNEYANAEQRLAFSKQFYGPSFMLISSAKHKGLAQVFQEKPEKKPFILSYMKDALESLIQKEALGYTFVHNLFLEYLTHSDDTERQVMAESLQEHVANIVHTREGARAAMYVVWYSSAKGRKVIIKQIKPFLEKLLTEEYGHMLLLAIFDAVDDTKFVTKLVISDIIGSLDKLVADKWGRHIIMYLLNARDPQHVNKEIRELLSTGDSNPFSKKEMEVRQRELRAEISPACLSFATDNLDTLMSNNSLKMLLFAILKHASGDKQDLLNVVIELYNKPYSIKAASHILDDKAMRFTVRKMLQSDDTGSTSEEFIDGISSSVFQTYSKTEQGCYFIAELINSSKDAAKKKLIKIIAAHKNSIAGLTNNTLRESLLSLI